jgi:hypothetical protein
MMPSQQVSISLIPLLLRGREVEYVYRNGGGA